MYFVFGKRLIDFTIAAIGLITLSPLLLFVGLVIVCVDHMNPVFIQKRPGRNEQLFGILKFRTMKDCFDGNGNLLPDNNRITRLGRILRRTSIDELPQLWNVIKGEMSLVGPRPLLIEYLTLYNKNQRLRHNVKPGITGWAQLNGRGKLSFEEKLELDVWYVRHQSLKLDLKILFHTIWKVIMQMDK